MYHIILRPVRYKYIIKNCLDMITKNSLKIYLDEIIEKNLTIYLIITDKI